MTTRSAVLSHVGLRRKNNEDDFLAADSAQLYIVCDGLGGRDAGEIASSLTTRTIECELAAAGLLTAAGRTPHAAAEGLRRAIRSADSELARSSVSACDAQCSACPSAVSVQGHDERSRCFAGLALRARGVRSRICCSS